MRGNYRHPGGDSVRSGTLLLGALSVAVLLAACSTGPGPLASGGWGGSVCIPSRLYPEPAVGMWLLDNTGSSPVMVISVKLPSHGLAMTKAWLVPEYKSQHNTTDYFGDQAGWPPIRYRTWPDRQPIPGAVIKPGQELNLIFGVTLTGSGDGTTDGPVITYTAGRGTYTMQAGFGIDLIAIHGHCPH